MTKTLTKNEFLERVQASTSERPSWLLSPFDDPAWTIPNDDSGDHVSYTEDSLRVTFFQKLPDGTDLTDDINACFLNDLKQCLIFAMSPFSPNRLNRYRLLRELAYDLKHLAVFFAYNDMRDEKGDLSLSAAEPWRYREFCARAAKAGAFGVRYIHERSHRLLVELTASEASSVQITTLKDFLWELGLPPNKLPGELAQILHSFGITLSTKSRLMKAANSSENVDFDYYHVNKRSSSRYNSLVATWQYLYNARHYMQSPLSFDPSDDYHRPLSHIENVTAPKRRTQSIPNDIAFSLLNAAARWCFVYQPHITEYVHRLEATLNSLRAGRTAKREYYMEKAFDLVDQSEIIREIGVARYAAHKRGTDTTEQFQSPSVENLRHLCTAAFLILTATLTARRRSELVQLSESDILHLNGCAELRFLQRKSKLAGPNKRLTRPIPTILSSALEEYMRMDQTLRKVNYPEGTSPLFVSQCGARLTTLQNLFGVRLQFFFDYVRHHQPDLRRWSLKPHQLRRLFAQLYFWHRPNSNLDSLTWFLGHLSTNETLIYLTGSQDELDFTHEESQFISRALSTSDSEKNQVAIDPSLRSFLQNNDVTISDFDSVHYHIRKLISKGMVKSRRLRFNGDGDQPLIAIEFKHHG